MLAASWRKPCLDKFLKDGCLYIYMEYMIGGSMASVLHQFGAFEDDAEVFHCT